RGPQIPQDCLSSSSSRENCRSSSSSCSSSCSVILVLLTLISCPSSSTLGLFLVFLHCICPGRSKCLITEAIPQSFALYFFHHYVLLSWESLVSLRWRSCRNCHNFDLLLSLLTSPKLAGWVGTSSVFPHAGCIEECWRVLIFGHEVKLSSYAICEEHILRVQTRVHQSTSDWKKGEDPELSLYAE
ncbi:hypothetical protein DVH24_015463, partial [Malus domestica]